MLNLSPTNGRCSIKKKVCKSTREYKNPKKVVAFFFTRKQLKGMAVNIFTRQKW